MFRPLLNWFSDLEAQTRRSPRKRSRRPAKRSPVILFLLLLLWSLTLGWGLAQAQEPDRAVPEITRVGTVDLVPERYQVGQRLYLEHCGTCHVALPPAVMPTETWRELLLSPEHYGTQINLPNSIERRLVWNYITLFSRPLLVDEAIPYRLAQSRYLKALHPQVEFSRPVRLGSCATCHPGTEQFDFRSLSAEWQ